MEEIIKILNLAKSKIGYPSIKVLQTATGPIVKILDKEIVMMGSYNYLGLANNSEVKKRAAEVMNEFGVGTGGVRLLTGTMGIHLELEKMVADFTGHQDSITVASGFGTNAGVISGVMNLLGFRKYILGRKGVIFSDELNHASIVDGCKLSDAEVVVYKHNNVQDLEKLVRKYKRYRKLIVTDGVFSMDGDVCRLDSIVNIAKEYDCLTMIDEAHAFGVLGDTGAGTAEQFNIKGSVDLNMGTFSKGIGVSGGFVSCSSEMAEYLRIACRTYMFSDALSPAIVGAVIGSLEYIKKHPELIVSLRNNSKYFRDQLNLLGFDTFSSSTQVVPVLIGEDSKTMAFFDDLFNAGIFAPAVRWPAVPRGTGRIRFSLMASHSKENLDKTIDILADLGKKYKIIN